MKKLAICVPVYKSGNNDLRLVEIYGQKMQYLNQKDVDVYFFDSSQGNEINNIVEKMDGYRSYIYYYRYNSSIHSNVKVFEIFKKKEIINNYEYMWVLSDAYGYSEEYLDKILEEIDNHYDMLIVSRFNKKNREEKIYHNPNELFHDHAVDMSWYGGTILNIHKILESVDWEKYEKKYLKPNTINFSHMCFYFDRILEIEDFCAKELLLQELSLHNIKISNQWEKHTIYIFGYIWPSAVLSIPEYYTQKEKVIEQQKYIVNMSFSRTVKVKINKGLNWHVFRKSFKYWKSFSTVSYFTYIFIFLCPIWLLKKYIDYIITNKKKSMRKFFKKHKNVYLYGAGKYAKIMEQYLLKNDMNFSGFLVSKQQLHNEKIDEYSVYIYDKNWENNCKNNGYIICTNKGVKDEIRKYLKENKCRMQEFDAMVLLENM